MQLSSERLRRIKTIGKLDIAAWQSELVGICTGRVLHLTWIRETLLGKVRYALEV